MEFPDAITVEPFQSILGSNPEKPLVVLQNVVDLQVRRPLAKGDASEAQISSINHRQSDLGISRLGLSEYTGARDITAVMNS
jgi:hypothetical protein